MAAKKPTNIQTYEAARQFVAHVNWLEDNRFALREALMSDSTTADNVMSALGRLCYELGQLHFAERDYRRTRSGRA